MRWRDSAPGQYIDLEWQNGNIYLEDGPDVWPKRGHEGGGGSFSIQDIRRGGHEFLNAYDGLYDRLIKDLAPQFQVSDALRGVVVTLDADVRAYPTPCRFAFKGDRVYVYPATAEPTEQLATYAQASLLVSEPSDGQTGATPSWWARIHGPARLVDDPEWELTKVAELFAEKYGATATIPDQVPTIRIDIDQWTSYPGDESNS